MAKKKRLGRGLDSLIPAVPPEGDAPSGAGPDGGGVRELPLQKVELNPQQPRLAVDDEELAQLAASIGESGVIQPIMVRPAESGGGMYELVCGERRLRACRLAGLETVPAIVRNIPDDKLLELALVENLQRVDLNPVEKARGIRRLIDELDLTQQQAGERLGMDRSTVANTLRLLDLAEPVLEMVSRGTLTAGHARALLSVADSSAQVRLARRVVSEGLSVRATERMAASDAARKRPTRLHPPMPHIAELEQSLSEALGTRVQIKQRRKGGRLVVHFRSHDDFERLYECLVGESTADYPERRSA